MDQGTTPSRDREDDATPRGEERRLGRYRVLREAGRGSNGVVYEALDEDLDRRVALKVLPANISLDRKTIQRFYREAEAAAKLSHPGIVPIYEINEENGTHFYAMEYIDGVSLDVFVKNHEVSNRDAARMIRDAARALQAAHTAGVIHRDVKPSNLMIRANGDVLISDFGLARHDKSATLTSTDAIVGTPRYMSPEQIVARQSRVDGRSDIYSLGITLYELITGRPPFDAETIQSFLKQVLEDPPTPPRKRDKNISRDLETIVLTAIARDANDRYQTAEEFANDLDRFLHSESILARRPGLIARGREYARRHRVRVLSVALGLAMLVAVLLVALNSGSKKEADFRVHLNDAVHLREAGDYAAAHAEIDAAIAVNDKSPDAWLERSRIRLILSAHERESFDEALVAQARSDLKRAQALGATGADTVEIAAQLAFLEQDWETAKRLASRVLEGTLDTAKRARFLYIRGGSRLALGELEAKADLEESQQLDPTNNDVRALLETVSDITGDTSLGARLEKIGSALAALGSEGSSTYGALTDLIARAASQSGRLREIGGDLLMSLVLNALPGTEAEASKDFETFDAIIARAPETPDPAALVGRGRARMRLGQFAESPTDRNRFFEAALDDFREAQLADSESWEPFYWAALIRVSAAADSPLSDVDAALAEAGWAVLNAPPDNQAKANDVLAEVNFRAGNKEEALRIIDELLEQDPERRDYYQRRRTYFVEKS